MNKNFFLKTLGYILSLSLLVVTVINYMYSINGKWFLLRASVVNVICFAYYLFIDHRKKHCMEFNKMKKMILLSMFLHSLFELVVLAYQGI